MVEPKSTKKPVSARKLAAGRASAKHPGPTASGKRVFSKRSHRTCPRHRRRDTLKSRKLRTFELPARLSNEMNLPEHPDNRTHQSHARRPAVPAESLPPTLLIFPSTACHRPHQPNRYRECHLTAEVPNVGRRSCCICGRPLFDIPIRSDVGRRHPPAQQLSAGSNPPRPLPPASSLQPPVFCLLFRLKAHSSQLTAFRRIKPTAASGSCLLLLSASPLSDRTKPTSGPHSSPADS